MLVWCDVEMGDDQKAAIDQSTRAALAKKLSELQRIEGFTDDLEEFQRNEIARLAGILNCIENTPLANYLTSMQEFERGAVRGQTNCTMCGEDEKLFLCSKCKLVMHCSQECQSEDWKEGKHKSRCFEPTF